MPRILAALAVAAALSDLVHAGISFTKPAAGDKLTAGSAIEVAWKDGGDGPALSEFSTYELHLCAGGNDAASIVSPWTCAGATGAMLTSHTECLASHHHRGCILRRKQCPGHGWNNGGRQHAYERLVRSIPLCLLSGLVC